MRLTAQATPLRRVRAGRLNQSVCEPTRLTIRCFRAHRPSHEPIYLAARERLHEGMRMAGVQEA
jgi:hypothetical protein